MDERGQNEPIQFHLILEEWANEGVHVWPNGIWPRVLHLIACFREMPFSEIEIINLKVIF
jgi:hypothetical protein